MVSPRPGDGTTLCLNHGFLKNSVHAQFFPRPRRLLSSVFRSACPSSKRPRQFSITNSTGRSIHCLDTYGYRISLSLNTEGFPSIWIPRDGYGSIDVLKEKPLAFFSHRHAAFLAGLGTFGINNMLLTEKFGPRVRFASIFTEADISPDPVMERSLCTKCMQCVDICPVKALDGREYPEGLTDKKTCAIRSEALSKRFISPCGFCIKVCPVGEDRNFYKREDCGIYDEKDTAHDRYHRAWKHVRSYGGR